MVDAVEAIEGERYLRGANEDGDGGERRGSE
jgi:hypothetical protein